MKDLGAADSGLGGIAIAIAPATTSSRPSDSSH